MIIVTGAAGFIGSCLVAHLNRHGYKDIVVVDDFSRAEKYSNLKGKEIYSKVHRDDFIKGKIREYKDNTDFIFHLGARTDTAEFNKAVFDRLNLNYSKAIWDLCAQQNIPLVYASSAATYGMGAYGYSDRHDLINKLKPLNPYGESKNEFDKWVLQQDEQPPFWAGLKFFNVYGPNEYHKGRMASVIFHAYRQIRDTGRLKLFRSHHPDYKDGEQCRDFVYVKDIAGMMLWLMEQCPDSAIYNAGSGKARTFLDLGKAVFKAMGKNENIQFVDTPEDIRDKYQYYTQADMAKLRKQGYGRQSTSLEDGVQEYVKHYLSGGKYY
ncbi:MAG: ADP-glyceromanno-heptose 6-epimerase [Bacteroidales bacterium]